MKNHRRIRRLRRKDKLRLKGKGGFRHKRIDGRTGSICSKQRKADRLLLRLDTIIRYAKSAVYILSDKETELKWK